MWVARDYNGDLYAYEYKPKKKASIWWGTKGSFCILPDNIFNLPTVTREDEEPTEIELKVYKEKI